MPRTPARKRSQDEEEDAVSPQPKPQAKRAAPGRAAGAAGAAWATLPTDLWKRALDFAYGPVRACVDALAPLKAAATLAAVSRGTQRAMADPGLWKDLARGSERSGCDKILLAADVGGFSAQGGRPWRVLNRALCDFLKKCTHCRSVEAPRHAVFGVRLCQDCATVSHALIKESRARDVYHLAAADLAALPFVDTPRRCVATIVGAVPRTRTTPTVTQLPANALVFSPRSGEVALELAPPVEEPIFGGAPFLSPPPRRFGTSTEPPPERIFARRHLFFVQQRRPGNLFGELDRDADAARIASDAARGTIADEEPLQAYSL